MWRFSLTVKRWSQSKYVTLHWTLWLGLDGARSLVSGGRCDPIWQMTSCSSDVCTRRAIRLTYIVYSPYLWVISVNAILGLQSTWNYESITLKCGYFVHAVSDKMCRCPARSVTIDADKYCPVLRISKVSKFDRTEPNSSCASNETEQNRTTPGFDFRI